MIYITAKIITAFLKRKNSVFIICFFIKKEKEKFKCNHWLLIWTLSYFYGNYLTKWSLA